MDQCPTHTPMGEVGYTIVVTCRVSDAIEYYPRDPKLQFTFYAMPRPEVSATRWWLHRCIRLHGTAEACSCMRHLEVFSRDRLVGQVSMYLQSAQRKGQAAYHSGDFFFRVRCTVFAPGWCRFQDREFSQPIEWTNRFDHPQLEVASPSAVLQVSQIWERMLLRHTVLAKLLATTHALYMGSPDHTME